MGTNIKNFNNWNRLNEDDSYWGWINNIGAGLKTAVTGVEQKPVETQTKSEPNPEEKSKTSDKSAEPKKVEPKESALPGLSKPKKVEPKVYEIKGWKVKEDCEIEYKNTNSKFKYKKGTLFIQLQSGDILQVKSSRENNRSNRYQLFNDLIPGGFVEEVKIEDEKWSHPHLLKEIKNKLKLK